MASLTRTARSVIAYVAAGSSPSTAARPRSSTSCHSSGSPINPALRHSAIPSRRRSIGSVASTSASSTISHAGQNAPTPFFALGRSMATLPPIAESAWASHVVGTFTSGTPRRCSAAARPPRSPTVPPPTTTSGSERSSVDVAQPGQQSLELGHRLDLLAAVDARTSAAGSPPRRIRGSARGRRRTPAGRRVQIRQDGSVQAAARQQAPIVGPDRMVTRESAHPAAAANQRLRVARRDHRVDGRTRRCPAHRRPRRPRRRRRRVLRPCVGALPPGRRPAAAVASSVSARSRAASWSIGASSRTRRPCSISSHRLSGSRTVPPPVAITAPGDLTAVETASRSSSRRRGSPSSREDHVRPAASRCARSRSRCR